MIAVPPIAITDAVLTSTTVVDVAPAAYAAGTTYALGNTVGVAGAAGLVTIYQSLAAGNTGNAPASSPAWWQNIGTTYQAYSSGATYALNDYAQDNAAHLVYQSLTASNVGNALSDVTHWLLIGPTNAWRMFDLIRDTQTSVPGAMTVVLAPGERVDALGLTGVVADSAAITVSSGGVVEYSATVDLDTRSVLDWYGYFFQPFTTQDYVALFDLPPYTNAVITIALSATSGNVACGAVVLGLQEYVGQMQYESTSDVLNFSTVTRDFAGNTATMVQRKNVPKVIGNVFFDKSRINRLRALRDAYNGTPILWSGLDDATDDWFEAFFILGFYMQFTIDAKYPETGVLSVELQEI